MLPTKGEYVNVIDNKTMKSVGKGRLTSFTRSCIVIEQINGNWKMLLDARIHHFEGYEPNILLVEINQK